MESTRDGRRDARALPARCPRDARETVRYAIQLPAENFIERVTSNYTDLFRSAIIYRSPYARNHGPSSTDNL